MKFRCAGILLWACLHMYMAKSSLAAPMFDSSSFSSTPVTLANGIAGAPIHFTSHSPVDFAQLIGGNSGPEVALSAQLFLPQNATKPVPAVILIPGSGNLGANYFAHAATLTSNGIAALLVDPFTGRGIKDTVADQNQFSFAASAYDTLAALQFLRSRPEIDATRIGATGGSRGGTAVLLAAAEPLSHAVLGKNPGLKAVVAGYPWCGLQFRSSRLSANAAVLILSGDGDNWVNPLQCQGQAIATERTGASISMKIFPAAMHSFDREGVPPTEFPKAIKATRLPTFYMDDSGHFYDLRTDQVNPALTPDTVFVYASKNGLLDRGATIGSSGTQAQEYSSEMLGFFRERLLR